MILSNKQRDKVQIDIRQTGPRGYGHTRSGIVQIYIYIYDGGHYNKNVSTVAYSTVFCIRPTQDRNEAVQYSVRSNADETDKELSLIHI